MTYPVGFSVVEIGSDKHLVSEDEMDNAIGILAAMREATCKGVAE